MIVTLHPHGVHAPKTMIDAVIARHGAWKVLAASAASILRSLHRKPMVSVGDLSPHLRRDIGLPPEPTALRHWDL